MEDLNQSQQSGLETSVDELALLKQRARLMGLDFSNNIKAETLREKINSKLDESEDDTTKASVVTNPLGEIDDEEDQSPMAIRRRMNLEQKKLIRVRVTCMDPKKKDLPGEIFTIANEYLGTVSKFVPFGEATDDGYHLPYCLYTMMNDRKFLNIRTVKDKKTGTTSVQHSWAKEFALEILPPLTSKELQALATAQIAAGSLDGITAE